MSGYRQDTANRTGPVQYPEIDPSCSCDCSRCFCNTKLDPSQGTGGHCQRKNL